MTKWIAYLNNGEVVAETPPGKGELSAWQGLLFRLRQNGERITMLQLQMNGARISAIPKAAGYVQCSEMHRDLQTKAERHSRGIGSIFGDHVVMIWVDDKNNIWQDIRPLTDLKLHSTIV